jgi:hypothetical protein
MRVIAAGSLARRQGLLMGRVRRNGPGLCCWRASLLGRGAGLMMACLLLGLDLGCGRFGSLGLSLIAAVRLV